MIIDIDEPCTARLEDGTRCNAESVAMAADMATGKPRWSVCQRHEREWMGAVEVDERVMMPGRAGVYTAIKGVADTQLQMMGHVLSTQQLATLADELTAFLGSETYHQVASAYHVEQIRQLVQHWED